MKEKKRQRIQKILQIVNDLGKALPQEIMNRYYGSDTADDVNESLKRSIYRDLKELADEGSIEAQYFLPNGAEIDLDEIENFKNIRVFYCSNDSQHTTFGQNLIERAGGAFLCSQKSGLKWTISEKMNAQGKIWISFFTPISKRLHISVAKDNLPVTLLITRAEQHELSAKEVSMIEQRFGYMFAVFSCWDQTVSRPSSIHRLCHCALKIHRNQSLEIIADPSPTKTFFKPAQQDELKDFLFVQGGETGSIDKILARDQGYQEIKERVLASFPILVKAGNFTFLVHEN